MQRRGSRTLLLPAAVFLVTGYGSTLQNSLALPPARSQHLETAFHSPATTVPLREPPRRGQHSRPISSAKFQAFLPARSVFSSRLCHALHAAGDDHRLKPVAVSQTQNSQTSIQLSLPSRTFILRDRSARLAALSENLTFVPVPMTLHSPNALISLSNYARSDRRSRLASVHQAYCSLNLLEPGP